MSATIAARFGLLCAMAVSLLAILPAVRPAPTLASEEAPHMVEGVGAVIETAGWLSVVWGDGEPGTGYTTQRYWLEVDAGQSVELRIDDKTLRAAGGALALNRQHVGVQGSPIASNAASFDAGRAPSALLQVESLRLAQPGPDASPAGIMAGEAVTGTHRWISILCKFSDVVTEPNPLSFFQGMYADTYPGLGHYWREQSFNKINLLGSGAVGWFVLPKPRSFYIYDMNGDGSLDADLSRLADDCTGVADAAVHFPDYKGVNLMFNANLDCCAWGGGRYLNRDGQNRYYSMTWEPPWGYANIGVMAHEMGHGFGLPHSSGNYGEVYDNQWDVMSGATAGCNRPQGRDSVYGCLGQHTISHHKNLLGWITPTLIYTVTPASRVTLTLENLATTTNSNYLMVKLPQGSPTRFKTIEARKLTGYDSSLPGAAVIVHDVDTTRSEPAHVVDIDSNGNTGDAGAMWTVGESFLDVMNQALITVSAQTANGFRLMIGPAANRIKRTFLPMVRLSVVGDAYEPDNTAQDAKTIASGAPQTRSIIPAADVDWAKFTISAPSAVTLQTSGPAGAYDDTRLWLYDAGLSQIDYNDDISYPSNNYSRISRQCGVNPLAAGTYYAKVDEWGNNNTIATYYLSLTVSPCP